MSNKFEHYKEKQIYFYRILDEKTCSVYDGSEIFTMTHKEKINILKNNFKQEIEDREEKTVPPTNLPFVD